VLVDFWTYGCYNCVNTLPHVTRLYDTYRDKGLVVVGIHTPEFPFEKSLGNLQAALKRHGIHYPVAQDKSTPRGTPIETNIGRRNT
jgi:thiol-disulfide isomerase/thioredoxin